MSVLCFSSDLCDFLGGYTKFNPDSENYLYHLLRETLSSALRTPSPRAYAVMRREAEQEAEKEQQALDLMRQDRASTEQRLRDALADLAEERLRHQKTEQTETAYTVKERLADLSRR